MSRGKKFLLNLVRTKFKLLASISKRKAAVQAFQLFITPQSKVRKQLPPAFLKAERLQITFEEARIIGYRWNHPQTKKLLILHGYESSVVNFEKFINPLIKEGYEVLAFDAPAHGRSGGRQIHAVSYKKFIQFLGQEFGPIKNFITHSFGGLALALALEEFDHDESYKVVFIAPATESTTAMDRFFKLIQLDATVRKEFNALITEANNQPPEWYSVARAAENIKAQVLFLQDKEDDLTPLTDVEPIIQKNYSNFKFIITEGLGHKKIYRDASVIKSVIEFFK